MDFSQFRPIVVLLVLSMLTNVHAAAPADDADNSVEPVEPADGKSQADINTGKTAATMTDETHAKHAVDAFELPEVEVVSTTPVGSSGLALKKISGNVQSAEDEEINRHEAVSLPDFMNRRMESVNIGNFQSSCRLDG
jgi:hypothetical protein